MIPVWVGLLLKRNRKLRHCHFVIHRDSKCLPISCGKFKCSNISFNVANLIDRYSVGNIFEHPKILEKFSFSGAFLYFIKYFDSVLSNQPILMVISFSFVATFVLNQRSFNLSYFIIMLNLMKIVASLIHTHTFTRTVTFSFEK